VRNKVIVIGGGIAGMSAAHELALRDDFEVVVYELRSIPGGKARSMPAKAGHAEKRRPRGDSSYATCAATSRHVTAT
jgi:15-cis-phytoene desaturase